MTDKELMATDLMIGDWVNVTLEGETFKGRVTSINGDTEDIKVSLYSAPLGWEDGDDFEEIKPILLTAEILKKNGFEERKSSMTTSYRLRHNNGGHVYISLRLQKEGYEMAMNYPPYWIYLKCVHELQHFLRICGIDKEIVL